MADAIAIDPASPDWREQALQATGGAGYDFVIEAAGSADGLETAVALSARHGRILLYGVARPTDRASVPPYDIYAEGTDDHRHGAQSVHPSSSGRDAERDPVRRPRSTDVPACRLCRSLRRPAGSDLDQDDHRGQRSVHSLTVGDQGPAPNPKESDVPTSPPTIAVGPARFLLADRVAVVTGAGGPFGRSISTGLARAGASLFLTDINGGTLAETVDAVRAEGRRCESATGDVSRPEDIEAIMTGIRWRLRPARCAREQRRDQPAPGPSRGLPPRRLAPRHRHEPDGLSAVRAGRLSTDDRRRGDRQHRQRQLDRGRVVPRTRQPRTSG